VITLAQPLEPALLVFVEPVVAAVVVVFFLEKRRKNARIATTIHIVLFFIVKPFR
jgi:hypothetical protein